MICISTRGQTPPVSMRAAVLAGLAPDGGLFVPERLDRLPDSWWQALRGRSFQEVAIAVAIELAGDEFDRATIESIVRDALNFDVPIVRLTDRSAAAGPSSGLAALELFHGPTFAFKDFGARTLARLIRAANGSERLTVLVATSGDTGSAVAHAFLGVPGTRVVVLYPEGQVSDVQEAQFTTLGGNVTAVSVRGTFDDCQRLAKEAFADPPLRQRCRLTSANSISLGRLLPQVFYYAYAASRVDGPVRVSVPSGNFGNLAAGVIAWKLGAPVASFSAPTTVNDTVPRYLATGRVEPHPSVSTLANAMDVGNPSNLERLRWLFDDDLEAMRSLITSTAHTDDEVRSAIRDLYDRYGYIADPHTAIAYLGALGTPGPPGTSGTFFLSTAHPAKFREVVEPVIGRPVLLPPPLAEALARKKLVTHIGPRLEELADLL